MLELVVRAHFKDNGEKKGRNETKYVLQYAYMHRLYMYAQRVMSQSHVVAANGETNHTQKKKLPLRDCTRTVNVSPSFLLDQLVHELRADLVKHANITVAVAVEPGPSPPTCSNTQQWHHTRKKLFWLLDVGDDHD